MFLLVCAPAMQALLDKIYTFVISPKKDTFQILFFSCTFAGKIS